MTGVETATASLCAGPHPPERAPGLCLPRGACDTHFHVFGDEAAFPLVSPRSYTPPACSYDDYRAMADQAGIERGVIVQPSIYGTDNRLLVRVLAMDPSRLRAVAVLTPAVTDAALAALHALGVRGLRINLCNPGPCGLDDIAALGPRIAPLGWHFQLHLDLGADGIDIAAIVGRSPVPIVIDHFGLLPDHSRTDAFASLLRGLDTGRCWVKLSAPYRCGTAPPPWPGLRTLARTLIAYRPDRLLWGSDWPHPGLVTDMPDDAGLVDLLEDWCGDASTRRAILVKNPQALYWAS